ncbi:MAG TPA: discoidin domain-containing protein [Janthinobacterium sp.]|nr:discoidin domain-containing protein [Janthinobacterium sp.]
MNNEKNFADLKRSGQHSLGVFARTALAACVSGALLQMAGMSAASAQTQAPYNLALNRPVYASSIHDNNTPDLAIDGSLNSRWESAWQVDNQWIYVDLGAVANVTGVQINWENAFATDFRIEVSNDEINWTLATPAITGNNSLQNNVTFAAPQNARYVRMFGLKRVNDAYGYSIFEFQVMGTGGANPPPSAAPVNLALGATVTASSTEIDQPGHPNELSPDQVAASNVNDGSIDTRWSSSYDDKQWIQLDLGSTQTIGSVELDWQNAYGRAYDIQVSDDGKTWSTVYRQLTGSGGNETIPMFASGRYVRMQGIARGTSFGYSLFEFKVFPYIPGTPQTPAYPIPTPSTASAVQVGQGSYEQGDLSQLEPPYPLYKTTKVVGPVPSNDWWQSLLIANLGNGNSLITLPFRSVFTKSGLAITNINAPYAQQGQGGMDSDGPADLFLMPNTINPANIQTKVDGYGDYSVNVITSDDNTAKMTTTLVQGSPYIFNTFANPDKVQITAYGATRFFDDGGNPILTADFQSYTGDHIGIEIATTNNAPAPQAVTRWYGIYAPAGSTFLRIGSTIKITLANGQNYLSLSALPAALDLKNFYQHAYAFVTGTKVDYAYDPATSLVTTNFTSTTTPMRGDLSADTVMGLLPHQWKLSDAALTGEEITTIRGALKLHEGNTFMTVNRFNGVLPQFVEPSDPSYSRAKVASYLDLLDDSVATNYMNNDPYWQGKALHPLAQAILVADQMGDTVRRDGYVAKLKIILTDWLTYSATEPVHGTYFHYSPGWGSIFAYNSGFGLNTGLTDHHFTYGYFTFAASVLATYDKDFLTNYGGMVEMLLRDYANPSRTDAQFPYFRNFDPYEGHSWAGGFGDNRSGNNQEAAGEALFGWVGEYLWGTVTGNTTYRDAGIYGFTTEEKSIEQYWFNYDRDNWPTDFTHAGIGQVYGSAYNFGTFFSGDPQNIYGIHWCPTSEWVSYYGRDPAKAATLYAGEAADHAANSFDNNGNPIPDTWQHIIWPFESLSDAQGVLAKMDDSLMQANERFNSYWFIHGMATLGTRSGDIWGSNWPSTTIYKNGANYTAQVWNPTATTQTVTFKNDSGVTGSTTVPPLALVSVDPTKVTVAVVPPPAGSPYLDRTGWTATSNPPSNPGRDQISNMFDGDTTTRWSTDTVQVPGMYFIVDMKAVKTFDTLAIKADGNDVANGYEIYLSNDGLTWGTAVAKGNDQSQTLTLSLGVQNARYIKMVQTGSSQAWWSIDEFKVGNFSAGAGTPPAPAAPTGTAGRDGWAVTTFASFNTDVPANMIDGSTDTVWSSSVPQAPGQWVQIDMGKTQTVDTVVMDAGSHGGDYARAYQIYLSTDGSNWGTPVFTQAAGSARDTAVFTPQVGRYMKIVNTGTLASNWWSIAELNVAYNGVGPVSKLPRTGWSLSASATGEPLSNMLDGDNTTRWTSGQQQAPNQWLQIDLGSVTSFKQLDFDANSNDFARGYQVYVSNDAVNWGNPVATGEGTSAYISAQLGSQNARYIKLVQTGASANWWSIVELNLFN